MEKKSISLELKDINKEKREAVIGHAIYDSIDRARDIGRRGMFTKSWNENKDEIAFYFNHDDTQAPGRVINLFDDEKKAYTHVKLGNHTLGNDVLIMMDEGIATKASYGYITEKKNFINIKGQKVRELKEVQHLETSVLTKMPCHPDAGVVMVTKSMEFKALSKPEQELLKLLAGTTQSTLEMLVAQSAILDPTSDLYTWICWQIERHSSMIGDYRSQIKWSMRELGEIKSHVAVMEKFIRNTKASDECIKSISEQLEETKIFLAEYDTDATQLITEPVSSKNAEAIRAELKNINQLFKQAK